MTMQNKIILHELEDEAITIQKKIEHYKQLQNPTMVNLLEEQYEGIINQMSEFQIT